MTTYPFESGSTVCKGMQVDRVLRVSTAHMPDCEQDLSKWHWGEHPEFGLAWIWAYEEQTWPDGHEEAIPDWLFQICLKARQEYGCNWILLDPDGDEIPDLPTYEH